MNMNTDKILGEGLTFDDVLIVPNYSEVLPRQANTTSRLTREYKIPLPILSAAMDTVTEYLMAIAMAQHGGMGILHKNMTIDRQASQVRRVKRAQAGMVLDPVTISPGDTIKDAKELMANHKIGGIPVIDDDSKLLIGIVTNRDLRFIEPEDESRLVSEIMTGREKLVTAKDGINMDAAKKILQENRIEKLPVVDSEGRLVSLITYKDISQGVNFPNANTDSKKRLMVGAAVGITADTLDRVEALYKAAVDIIVVDTAHGHSAGVIKEIKKIKAEFPDLQLIAGNVATGEGALALAKAGADAIKVGIGPGSICTTRIIAGIGVPQLTAIMWAAQALKEAKLEIPIIADGGIRHTGDVTKAIVAGASTVMLGSMFAGTRESPGEEIFFEGRKVKTYRGMGSIEAMKEGSKDRYFQDAESEISKLVPEGIVGYVPFKGSLRVTSYINSAAV